MLLKEKVELYGVERLLPFESISLITSIDLEILEKYKTLKDIFNNIDTIQATKLQKNKLKALKNIVLFNEKEDMKRFKISNPWDVYKYFIEEMSLLEKEVFKIVLLNSKNKIIEDINISVGTLNSALVHPREVFKEAIKKAAHSMILIHNHPSGSLEPSLEDKNTTQRLCSVGELVGIKILDHIIIGNNSYFSFKENCIIF